MTRRRTLFLVLTLLFTVVNLVGAGFAGAGAEWWHAGGHVAAGLLGAWVAWRLARRDEDAEPFHAPDVRSMPQADERIEQLQQSIDSVALELERLGEAQRYHAKLEAERASAPR